MRYVVFGAGAIGGVVGARFHQAGHEVVLIARGAHGAAMADRGLRLRWPGGDTILRIPVVAAPSEITWRDDDVVLLSVKGQDTEEALAALVGGAPSGLAVACLQNGVENERKVLRLFERTYAVCVMCPASHLEPGSVIAHSAPVTGLFDVGRYPGGTDPTSARISADFGTSTFDSRDVPDVMRWKYTKLLMNLANAVEALFRRSAAAGLLAREARREGVLCLEKAGIAYASAEEEGERRAERMTVGEIDGRPRPGGSSWQSLARGTGTIEADYLNGEVVLLGRRLGVPVPVNGLLQRESRRAAREGLSPGSLDAEPMAGEVGLVG